MSDDRQFLETCVRAGARVLLNDGRGGLVEVTPRYYVAWLSDELLAAVHMAVAYSQGVADGHREGHACERFRAEAQAVLDALDGMMRSTPTKEEVRH